MKNRMLRFETCSFYDSTGMERHLEHMAARGWMIEQISAFGWRYRRIPPTQIHFAVAYYPPASDFDPEPTEGQRTLQDFCVRTGWQLACTQAQIQIYYNEDADPLPLETDPVVKVTTLHREAKKSYLPAFYLLLAVALLQCAMFFTGLKNDPIRVLASPSAPCTGAAWILLLLLCVTEIGGYYRWRRRAVKAAAQGLFTEVKGHSWRQRVLFLAILPGFLYWLVTVLATGPAAIRLITVVTFLSILALYGIALLVREFLKRRKAPRTVNQTVTLLSIVFLSFFLTGAVLFAAIRSAGRGRAEAGQQTYEYGGITWTVYEDELPLTLKDLMEIQTDSGLYTRQYSGNESLLLGQYDMQHQPRVDTDNYSELPGIDYTVTVIKVPALYALCRNSLLRESRRFMTWQPCEASPWSAQEAYRMETRDGEAVNRYLLCYSDRIIDIDFSWEPSPKQMRIVGQIMVDNPL